MKKYICFLSIIFVCGFLYAQPNLSQEANTSVLSEGSLYYDFATLNMKAKSNGQNYKIYLAIPKKSSDYNVVYMLDGNAVLDVLNEELLKKANAANLLIVMIGYVTKARFDTIARTYDYTPLVPSESDLEDVQNDYERVGGAELFLEFIENELKPKIAKTFKINSQKQILWGHSYGGLFVLYTLFTHPDYFQKYAAISPSLWWHNGYIKEVEATDLRYPTTLIVMAGDDETKYKSPQNMTKRAMMQGAIPKNAIKDMIFRLNKKTNLSAYQITLENLSHGETFKASIGLLFDMIK
ncbi:MAG: prolyl oligopeptidase family serine peptidase [Campylobacteraceae bacterium]|jgi:predicted alpha/beta superfamily hydrolase|nr:prolyl oligopeptidase family serine peptidase [Campylobacteraceae bacterium]